MVVGADSADAVSTSLQRFSHPLSCCSARDVSSPVMVSRMCRCSTASVSLSSKMNRAEARPCSDPLNNGTVPDSDV